MVEIINAILLTGVFAAGLMLLAGWFMNLVTLLIHYLEGPTRPCNPRPSHYRLRLLGVFLTPLGAFMGWVR